MKLTTILGTDLTVQNVKYTDLTYLKEIAEGSNEFMRKMIETFIAQTPPMLNNMELYLKEEKWDELKKVAHKMKPSIDFMGIHSIWENIKNVEIYAGEQKHLELMPDLIKKIKKTCFNAIEELEEEIKRFP